jgi:SAM-dependent methyltransferase
VPDALFHDPRLASLYDVFDDDRSDLDPYVEIARRLGARRVLDLGCGTGVFALRMAALGHDVIAVDPAAASLDVARSKPGAERVDWRLGDATVVTGVEVDLVTMTGNAAQAVLGDAWPATLASVHAALGTDGCFVLESRVPARRAWESWTPELTRRRRDALDVGAVETWTEVTEVHEPLVSFRHRYRFPDGSELASDSTLEFRTLEQLTDSLHAGGFEVSSVLDAPDRPGLEYVIVAERRAL